MGGGGQNYGRNEKRLTAEEIRRRHRRVDSDAYIFDAEYEKLKKEQEKARAEYEKAREEYRRISEELRREMANGTATGADMERFMSVLTDRGVQLQQQQAKLQGEIDDLLTQRTAIDEQMNELRKNAFSGSTTAYQAADRTAEYTGFKFDGKRHADATIVEMTPQEYLRRVAFGANGEGSLQAVLASASPETVQNYMRKMLRGTKYNAPSIGGERGTTATNTARVIAAMMNGYSRIPVLVIE